MEKLTGANIRHIKRHWRLHDNAVKRLLKLNWENPYGMNEAERAESGYIKYLENNYISILTWMEKN